MQEIKKRTVHTVVYHPNDGDVLKSTLEKDGWTVHSEHRAINGFSELTLRAGLCGQFVVLKGDETIVDAEMLIYKREKEGTDD